MIVLLLALSLMAKAEPHFDQKIGEKIAVGEFVRDEFGASRELRSFFNGRPVILVFSYFKCPNLCGLILNGVAKAISAQDLGRDFDVLTLSIDPREKPPLARAKERSYLARLGLTEGADWHFLTADENQIQKITSSAGFSFERDQLTGEFYHPSGFLVLTPQGMISKYFLGVDFDPKKVRNAVQRAAHEKKGSVVNDLLLFCFHYDPLANRNGPTIMRAIRIAGVLSILLLALFFIWLKHKEKLS